MSANELFGIESSALREAMQTVMPRVPEYAAELPSSPRIIRRALLKEVDLTREPRGTLPIFDQVECTTIMGETGRTLNAYMITGTGRDARFKDDPPPEYGESLFYGLMRHIGSYANHMPDDEPWMLPAAERFNELVSKRSKRPDPAPEGRRNFDLMKYWQALRAMGLLANLNGLVRLVNDKMETGTSPDKKTRIAHDLSYLVLTRAGINGTGMFSMTMEDNPLDALEGEIIDLSSGVAIFKPRDNDAWRDMYPRVPEYATPTLKCPFHQPDVFGESTPLTDQLHAGITAAHEVYDAFNT